MADRPIIFSAPMIRALLAGRKTQTRQILTAGNTYANGSPWPHKGNLKFDLCDWSRAWIDTGPSQAGNLGPYLHVPWPYEPGETLWARIYPVTQPGDRLWVKETFCPVDDRDFGAPEWTDYRATPKYAESHPAGWDQAPDDPESLKWKSPRFMPKSASRLTLIVESVKVERLQEISEEDANAEGVELAIAGQDNWGPIRTYRTGFVRIWRDIHGDESWAANPFVAAISFNVIRQNIAVWSYNERLLLEAQNAEFKRALELICAPVPFDALSDPTFKSLGRLFAARMEIAQRALRGLPLMPIETTDASELIEQDTP